MVAANINIASGAPSSRLGFYGPNQTNPNLGYGSYYHWCDGQPSPPGEAGHNPWTYIVTGSLEHRRNGPTRSSAFNVTVLPKTCSTSARKTQVYPLHGTTQQLNPRYGVPIYQTTPRYARFGINDDF